MAQILILWELVFENHVFKFVIERPWVFDSNEFKKLFCDYSF